MRLVGAGVGGCLGTGFKAGSWVGGSGGREGACVRLLKEGEGCLVPRLVPLESIFPI